MPVLGALDEQQCFDLLATAAVGRVVATAGGLPLVEPVPFALDGHAVVFRAPRVSALAAATSGAVVAFEVDEIEPALRSGWSVVLVGTASAVSSASEQVRLERLSVPGWSDDPDQSLIRITPGLVTGRLLDPLLED